VKILMHFLFHPPGFRSCLSLSQCVHMCVCVCVCILLSEVDFFFTDGDIRKQFLKLIKIDVSSEADQFLVL
jgi:hypothetical protein